MNPFHRVRKPCTGPYRCGRKVQTLAYVKAPVCRGCRRRLNNLKSGPKMTKHITVTLTRAEYDATVAALAEKSLEGQRDEHGPALSKLDVLDALRAMERAAP